jgi:hypothetical protein
MAPQKSKMSLKKKIGIALLMILAIPRRSRDNGLHNLPNTLTFSLGLPPPLNFTQHCGQCGVS